MTAGDYPADPAERSRWIVERRGQRKPVDESRAYAATVEEEPNARGEIVSVATIFLTNRECPWTCVMCDLWRNTTAKRVGHGSIPKQIEGALRSLPRSSTLKLYNSGSFFDGGAIPREDWPAIAGLCAEFDHVIVESHPRLIGGRVLDFARRMRGSLEVAMGLETCHPQALASLNKRFTLDEYGEASSFLSKNGVAIRAFLLVHPPFVPNSEQWAWLTASIRFAFEHGANVVSLIPTRLGNGALEALGATEPALGELERAQEFGLSLRAGRVFADTWDFERFARCAPCAKARRDRVARMNLTQRVEPRFQCERCADA